ncbi:MAG: glycosyltransferase family 2 protein [Flavobacteriales bacterium]|nr:glycosyltransferase family 2 protein [Flavobacteriales bacterium]
MNGELVSVVIYTYNQEEYIEQAIKSVLAQQTTFKFHIYIFDDGSTDTTPIKLKLLKEQNNEFIDLHLSKDNVGQKENSIYVINDLKSKYIAVLDGDDFWSFNFKLEKQVKFLENDTIFNACFHDLSIQSEENVSLAQYSDKSKSFYKTYSQLNNYTEEVYSWQIVRRLIPPISAMLFKTECVQEAYKEILADKVDYKVSFGWVFCLLTIRNSKFKYFNETWGVYRDHKGGVTKYVDNDEFIKPVIFYLKKMLSDSFYKSMKSDIYAELAQHINYLLSNSKNMTLFRKRLQTIKIIYYRFLQGLYKAIEINRDL